MWSISIFYKEDNVIVFLKKISLSNMIVLLSSNKKKPIYSILLSCSALSGEYTVK